MPIAKPFHLQKWIDENRDLLKPPVGNQCIYKNAENFIVMVVGGPNARKDYHYNESEELYYQVEAALQRFQRVAALSQGWPPGRRRSGWAQRRQWGWLSPHLAPWRGLRCWKSAKRRQPGSSPGAADRKRPQLRGIRQGARSKLKAQKQSASQDLLRVFERRTFSSTSRHRWQQ